MTAVSSHRHPKVDDATPSGCPVSLDNMNREQGGDPKRGNNLFDSRALRFRGLDKERRMMTVTRPVPTRRITEGGEAHRSLRATRIA